MSSIHNNYFLSNKVKVFPCAYRNSTYDASARLNTEYNFTHLPHMVDKASYIIKFNDKSKSEPEAKLICVIQGYYFEIELGTGDYTTLQNKYLNICVASPSSSNGENFIEGPHLCSWNSNNIEAGLDLIQATSSSSVYIFTGLQISELTKENPSGTLSREGYQCYALKLDASAKLPISTSKIEDSAKDNAGVPISSKFTTGSISTTSLNAKSLNVENDSSPILRAYSSGITANRAVQINSSLTSTSLYVQQTSSTPILKAWSGKVTIHKPTSIEGTNSNLTVAGTGKFGDKLTVSKGGADITGDTQIKKSSNEATDGNLKVAGIGEFGGKLTVTTGGASITGNTIIDGTTKITGTTTIGTDTNKTEIENDTVTTSKIIAGNLVIDKNTDNIIEIKNKAGNEVIFYVDTAQGEIHATNIIAGKINATVEGKSEDAENVTTSIAKTQITNIFGSAEGKISSLKLKTIDPGKNIGSEEPIKVIVSADSNTAVEFYKNSTGTSTVKAGIFNGALNGNATTADSFSSATTVSLTGNVTGTSTGSTKGWSVETKIADGAVTNAMLAGSIANDKLVNSSIKIGSKSVVALGSSIGTQDTPFKGDLYFGKQKSGNENDCSIIITGQYPKDGTEYPLKILDYDGNTLIQFTNNYRVFNTTSVPKQIIYAATDNEGRTELFGDKICIYAQGHDRLGGTIKAGMVDLSAHESNSGLWIRNIKQIHVNNASLKSSSYLKIEGTTVKIGDNKLTLYASNGNIISEGEITAYSFNATSDKRLKENIIDYRPEKSILDLPIKKFDFIDGPKNQIGCIAQDLKEICPEIVNENEKGYLSIQENKLVYLLLDEVKKLKNEVEELKRK